MTTNPIDKVVWLLILAVLGSACGRTPLAIFPHEEGSPAVPPNGGAADGGGTSRPPVHGACEDGFAPCGSGDALRCHDLSRSTNHCGACGHACAPGISCQAGNCQQHRCKGALSFNTLAVTSTIDQSEMGVYTRYSPTLGDFDGDGILDFVGVPGAKTPMSVLYGMGNGTFPTRRVIDSAWVWYWEARAADVDGDGFLDLASVANSHLDYSTEVTVRSGSGNRDAPFGDTTGYPTGKDVGSVLLADMDSDGRVDMVAGVRGALEYWRGEDGGRFEHQATLASRDTNTIRTTLLAMDWNGDGILDLVYGPDNVHFRLGRGDGSFDSETTCTLAMICAGDLDRDHRLDLVNGTGLLLGIEGCHGDKLVAIPDWPKGPIGGAALADLNGDDNLDLVADSGKAITVRTGDGKGGFAPLLSLPGTDRDWGAASVFLFGDLNRDGKLDIILTRTDGWRVHLNTCP